MLPSLLVRGESAALYPGCVPEQCKDGERSGTWSKEARWSTRTSLIFEAKTRRALTAMAERLGVEASKVECVNLMVCVIRFAGPDSRITIETGSRAGLGRRRSSESQAHEPGWERPRVKTAYAPLGIDLEAASEVEDAAVRRDARRGHFHGECEHRVRGWISVPDPRVTVRTLSIVRIEYSPTSQPFRHGKSQNVDRGH